MAEPGGPAAAVLTPLGAPAVDPAPRRPATVLHLLGPKWRSARARSSRDARMRSGRVAVLALVGAAFWAAVIFVLVRLLGYFRGVPEIGPLLAGKLLGIVMLSFFSILLLSNIITALSSFFLARDLEMVAASPADWLAVYGARLAETAVHSSWMVMLMAIPILIAYGRAFEGGVLFALVAAGAMVPFFIIPAVLGSALTLVLVRVVPARRVRDLLAFLAVLAGAALVLLVRLMRPEQLARPEAFRSLVDFIAVLRTPASPLLPSEWLQGAVMSWLTGTADLLPFYLLWSTAAALIVLGAVLHRALYPVSFTRAQESAGRVERRSGRHRAGSLLRPLGVLRRELVLKEMRLFFRDTTQWSQLVLLSVVVVVYVFNVKFLPLRSEGVTVLLANLIPFLNLMVAGFVLAAVAARFIFPGVSVEGRTLWLLRSSPMPVRELLWAKFWTGTLPLLALALAIVGITDALLQASAFMTAVSLLSVAFLTFALAGMALGFGALFPQFQAESAAQIPTSFGGLVYMMASVALIGVVVWLEARPVHEYLRARLLGTGPDFTGTMAGFAAAAVLCVVATFLPMRLAIRRLEATEL